MESVLHKNLSFLGNNILILWGWGSEGIIPKNYCTSTILILLLFPVPATGSCQVAPFLFRSMFYLWSPISALLPPTHSLTPKLLQFTSPQVGQLCKGLSSDQLGKNW